MSNSTAISNQKRLELVKYASSLLNASFALFIVGILVLVLNPFKDLTFTAIGLSIVIIGSVFLAGYLYVRVKIIEADYQDVKSS